VESHEFELGSGAKKVRLGCCNLEVLGSLPWCLADDGIDGGIGRRRVPIAPLGEDPDSADGWQSGRCFSEDRARRSSARRRPRREEDTGPLSGQDEWVVPRNRRWDHDVTALVLRFSGLFGVLIVALVAVARPRALAGQASDCRARSDGDDTPSVREVSLRVCRYAGPASPLLLGAR